MNRTINATTCRLGLVKIIETTGLTEDDIIDIAAYIEYTRVMQKVSEKHQSRIAAGETFEDEPTALANSGPRERAERRNPGKSALLNPPRKKR